MRKPKRRRVKATARPQVELTEAGKQEVDHWNESLLKAASLSAIAPIVERVKAYSGRDRGELLRQVARELKEDSLPLMRALAESGDRALRLATLDATSLVKSDEAAEIISPLAAEGGDNELRKVARRALEHLRSLGVRANVPLGAGIIAEVAQIERFQEALISSLNGLGQRMVSLAQRIPGHGIAVAQVAFDDSHGIYDCAVGAARRAEYDEMKEALSADPTRAFAVAPWDYGVQLLREARALNDASQTPAPESFNDVDMMLAEEKTKTYERPIVYEHLNADELADNKLMLAESANLLDAGVFAFWVLPRDKVRPLADKLKEADEAWVVVPEAAQQDRVNAIVRAAAESIFDGAMRVKLKRRLEEMSYVLLDGGDAQHARVALATALAMGSDVPLMSIPFVPALIDRSLKVLAAAPIEEGEDESRIILPFGPGRVASDE